MDRMDDLVQFLRACFDEDEQAALSWPEGSRCWQTVGGRRLSYRNGSSQTALPYADHPDYRDEWRP